MIYKIRFSLFIATWTCFFMIANELDAQPSAGATIPNNVCLNERMDITNNSSGATKFQWDFCVGNDFNSTPTTVGNILPSSISDAFGLKIVFDGSNYFGFATSFLNNSLYRLEYGESLQNSPQLFELGDLGTLDQPEGIDIIKEGNKWVGLVGHFKNSGGNVVRLIWDDLSEVPTAEKIGNFGVPSRIRDVAVKKQGNKYIAVLLYYNGNSIVQADFGNSMLTDISSVTTVQRPLSNVNLPIGFGIISTNSGWKMAVSSSSNKAITTFNFGNDLLSIPQEIGTANFPSFGNILKTKLVKDGNNFYALLATQTNTKLIDLKELALTDVYEEIVISNPMLSHGLDIYYQNGSHVVVGTTTKLNRMEFNWTCSSEVQYSETTLPVTSYTEAGTYPIQLTASDDNLNSDYILYQTEVSGVSAPDIALSFEGICVGAATAFTSLNNSANINNYNWSFGDSNTGIGETTSHTYNTSDKYAVYLRVLADNGCSNFALDSIQVYSAPTPAFDLPAHVVCTNASSTFLNQTADFYNGNLSYEWNVNGSLTGTNRDLSTELSSSGNNTVALTVSIPGCSNTLPQIVDVKEGPNVNFNLTDICQNLATPISNNTTGSGITQYTWDFGNGDQSHDFEPNYTYPTAGEYTVGLQVDNNLGCNTLLEKTTNVHYLPTVVFNNELSCSLNETQFRDQSTVNSANIDQWQWDFAGLGTSAEKDPIFQFDDPGTVQVTLTATSNFNCASTNSQSVDVKESPNSNFDIDPACIDDPFVFTNTSVPQSGGSISSNFWAIESDSYFTQNAAHTFSTSGDFTVSLTTTGSNFCLNTIEKTVEVFEKPDMDFIYSMTCENEMTTFQDNSDLKGDEVLSYLWNFGALGTSTEANPQVNFANSGTYDVGLRIQTSRECETSTTQQVEILPAPKALFIAFPVEGAAPLNVSFDNISEGSTSQSWAFNDPQQTTSTEFSPTFIYAENGRYEAELTSRNNFNCTDQAFIEITALVPSTDLALNNLQIVSKDNNLQLLLLVSNVGSSSITTFKAKISLGGKSFIEEVFGAELFSGEEKSFLSGFEINPLLNPAIDYFCVEIIEVNQQPDEDPSNNKECASYNDSNNTVLTPFPNPSTDYVNLPIISSSNSGLAVVKIIDTTGKLISETNIPLNKTGLIETTIDIRGLKKGSYILEVKENNLLTSHKFVKL